MKKKLKTLILVFWILIVVECVVAFFALHSSYTIKRVFDSISAGNWSAAQSRYDHLRSDKQDIVQDNLEEYAVFICNQYMDGKRTYEETAASFDAINAIDLSHSLMDKYLTDISLNEYKAQIRAIHNANQTHDSNGAYAASNSMHMAQLRITNEVRDQALIELLNDYYAKYLKEDITEEEVLSFVNLVESMAYGSAYDYCAVVRNNVDCVKQYRKVYAYAQSLYEEQQYMKIMDLIVDIPLDSHDDRYAKLFEDIREDAYEAGKVYYVDRVNEMLANDDKKNALALMALVESYYGEDVDLDTIKKGMASDWQAAYLDFLADVDRNVAVTGSKVQPDSVVLYDIDSNGTPEMFLYRAKDAGNDYIGSYIYTFENGTVKLIDYCNVRSFCTDSYLIISPTSYDGGGEAFCLAEYNGSSFSYGIIVSENDGAYVVDGAEADDVAYLSERTSILAHADAYNVGNSKGVIFEDSESYILAY